MKIKYYITYLLILIVLIFLNCGKKNRDKEFNIILLKDDIGVEFKFERFPERIISLAPNITETIYAIGADSLLVGITDYCNYPPSCKIKQSVGGMINPNLELISLLNPDLIILTVEGNSKSTFNSLINYGYNIFVTNPRDINGIIKMINDIGILTNHNKQASEIIHKIDSARNVFDSINYNNDKARALFLLSLNPMITVNSTTYINHILELSGFENIYSSLDLPYPVINYEDILLKNPDYIILTSELEDKKGEYRNTLSKYLSATKAMKENKIIIINADLISRPGPRIIQAIEELKGKNKKE